MKLTIAVAMYHEIMVRGKATIYLILFVKLKSKDKFPKKPIAKDIALRMISLKIIVKTRFRRFRHNTYQRGLLNLLAPTSERNYRRMMRMRRMGPKKVLRLYKKR